MPQRDVVDIGASTGGVEALSKIVRGLPADFPAALFVVLHVSEDAPSRLPAILNRVGALPAGHAVDRELIRRSRIYVAPPGLQTSLQHGRIGVSRGPRENRQRPSIDVLFRTAAHNYGPRVIGIVLTGALDDGSMGLAAIKKSGGLAIVQDPSDARVPSMPEHALQRAETDYCVAVDEIAPLLCALVGTGGKGLPSESPLAGDLASAVPLETVEEAAVSSEACRSEQLGPPSAFTCPDCSGTLFEIRDGDHLRFRCRVGHAYSEETFVPAQNEAVERALWVALRALEEREAIIHRLAELARDRGMRGAAERFDEKSRRVHEDVERVHDLIVNGRALEPVEAGPEVGP